MGSEKPERDFEGELEDTKIVEENRSRELPSASLVSRSSSSRASSLSPQNESIPKSKSDGDLSREQGGVSTTPAAHTPQWSMVSASPLIYSSQTTSPPVQTMETPSSFDPNRIPASVFSGKPANGSEWSVASNDSLFSIHMGNSSFPKDQFRSLDEWNASPSLYVTEAKSNELCSLPPLMEVPPNEEGSAKSSNVSSIEREDAVDSPKVAPRVSNESRHGSTSFAFPV